MENSAEHNERAQNDQRNQYSERSSDHAQNDQQHEQPFNSRYATRERIVRQYAAQDAQRARNARIYSQETAESYKKNAARAKERARQRELMEARRREEEAMKAAQRAAKRETDAAYARTLANAREHPSRSAIPLSSQESRNRTLMSQESYERARAMRDALSVEHQNRSPNRELIDARGSVDSRAFSENDELIGYSVNKADRPNPYVENGGGKSNTHWRSSDNSNSKGGRSKGFGGTSSSAPSVRNVRSKKLYANGNSNLFGKNSRNSVPTFVKIAVPVIIILAVILFLILR